MEIEKHIGKITYWNSYYGFIKTDDKNIVFFHRSAVKKEGAFWLFRSVSVSYELGPSKHGKNKGKACAINIEIVNKKPISEYNLCVGSLGKWSKGKGEITEAKREHIARLNKRRILRKVAPLKNDTELIYYPIKTSKQSDIVHAFFAYDLNTETDESILIKLFQKYKRRSLIRKIAQIKNGHEDITDEDLLSTELAILGEKPSGTLSSQVQNIISEYAGKGVLASHYTLSSFCSDDEIIRLFMQGMVNKVDIELLSTFFNNADAEIKRRMASLLKEDRAKVYERYLKHLIDVGALEFPNNQIKTALDIVYRKKSTQDPEIYFEIKRRIKRTLSPKNLVDLYLKGYLDDVDITHLENHLDFESFYTLSDLQKKDANKFKELINKVFDPFFENFDDEKFETNWDIATLRLKALKELLPEDFKAYLQRLQEKLSNKNLFTLWIFGLEVELDADKYFNENQSDINEYFKIKYIHRINSEAAYELDEEKLIQYIETLPWNKLILPIEDPKGSNQHYFLSDILSCLLKVVSNRDQELIGRLANAIWESIPKYSVHHVRLWLNYYVSESTYDYIGFRNSFKELSSSEKWHFKDRLNELIKGDEVDIPEQNVVKPCMNYEQTFENTLLYSAFLENLYFSDEGLKLKMHNNKFTKEHKLDDEFLHTGFNRLHSFADFNKIPLKIEVKQHSEAFEIETLTGFDELLKKIHQEYIKEILKRRKDPMSESNKDVSYVEDWKLRLQIIKYLQERQSPIYQIKSVFEHKSQYTKEEKNKELVQLFSIETETGISIIWENIDLNDDRATHIFKATQDHYETTIEQIISKIASGWALRSALIANLDNPNYSENDVENLKKLRSLLGYIGTIRRKRGDAMAFENWKAVFEFKINGIPLEQPTEEEKPNKDDPENVPEYFTEKPEIEIIEDFETDENTEPVRSVLYEKRSKVLHALKQLNEALTQQTW